MASWFPWGSTSSSSSSPPPSKKRKREARNDNSLRAQLATLPPHVLVISTLLLGGISTLGARYVYARYLRRIPNADWVTPHTLARRRWIKGFVTSVGDADNFRVYHTPGLGWRWPLKFRRIPAGRDLKDRTIHVRMAGVDAPEAGHFGRQPQPYAEESLAWLKAHVESKFVYCQLVRRDQYGRIVAVPHLEPRFLPGWLGTGKSLPLEMLHAGWCSVYEQSGAEYGSLGPDEFLRVQKEAQKARRGIWKKGTSGETPAEYKRRHREAAAAAASGEAAAPSAAPSGAAKASRGGWFSRLLRRRR